MLFYALISLLTVPEALSVKSPPSWWVITEQSLLEISGRSNVNNFCCEYMAYQGMDTLQEVWSQKKQSWELHGIIHIPANSFDCHHNILNNDFQKTLLAGKYPEIAVRVHFIQSKKPDAKMRQINGNVEITLAGRSRRYNLTCDLKLNNTNQMILEGAQVIRFSDFSLTPPRKIFGTIKVEDEISVKLYFFLKKYSL